MVVAIYVWWCLHVFGGVDVCLVIFGDSLGGGCVVVVWLLGDGWVMVG